MLVDQIVTYLEMTSPDQLVPGKAPPAEITLERADATELALIRSTNDRIATPYHWSSLRWSDQQWLDVLTRPGVQSWIARVSADVIGLVQLEKHLQRGVEITRFGLVPEYLGRGFGGHLLTLATRLAWDLGEPDRVWLHTSSLDHPHALSNYRSRGFRRTHAFRGFRLAHR